MEDRLLIQNKYNRISINSNFQIIIAIYIYHQEGMYKNTNILTLQQDNIKNYMILFHMLVFFKQNLHHVFLDRILIIKLFMKKI